MVKNQKLNYFIVIFLTILLTWLYFISAPNIMLIVVVITSVGIAIAHVIQKHLDSYQQAEYTHEKMMRNVTLDLTGLLLTMGVAMYVGRLAGGYFGLRAGFWIGLIAGFLGGFAAAWVVRSAWGKLVSVA